MVALKCYFFFGTTKKEFNAGVKIGNMGQSNILVTLANIRLLSL